MMATMLEVDAELVFERPDPVGGERAASRRKAHRGSSQRTGIHATLT